jgi:hypothetical protein
MILNFKKLLYNILKNRDLFKIMEVYIGVITKILDPDLYQIEFDVPERGKGFKAYPLRGEVDEPRVGDIVFLRELDPDYHSYFLYERLKENKFIGIRARGKKIKITEDFIEIGIYEDNDSWNDRVPLEKQDMTEEEKIRVLEVEKEGGDPSPSSEAHIRLKKNGDIEIYTPTTLTINGGQIKIKGGTLELPRGTVVNPDANGGPFWAGNINKTAPMQGTPMISGNILNLNSGGSNNV